MNTKLLRKIFAEYIVKHKREESKISSEICKECGGICCKNMGCIFSPHDFKKITKDILIDFIEETEVISIDWWEGDPRVYLIKDITRAIDKGECVDQTYITLLEELKKEVSLINEEDLLTKVPYIRMRNKNAPIIDPSYGGHECSILTPYGCSLDFEYRPSEARELYVPKGKNTCEPFYTKVYASIEWLEYHDILEEIIEHFGGYNPEQRFEYLTHELLDENYENGSDSDGAD